MSKQYRSVGTMLFAVLLAVTLMGKAGAQSVFNRSFGSPPPVFDSVFPNLQAERASGTIVDVAVATPALSTLVTALSATNLVTTLQGPGPFTVFAPTNTAFGKIPPAILDYLLANTSLLKAVLLYHVTAGIHDLGFAVEPEVLTTIQGENVFGRLVFNSRGATLKINNSNLVIRPILADNGLIYVIDSVLQPQF